MTCARSLAFRLSHRVYPKYVPRRPASHRAQPRLLDCGGRGDLAGVAVTAQAQAKYRADPVKRARERALRRAREAAVKVVVERHKAEYEQVVVELKARLGL